jgi:flagellar biosynthesis protein FlhG
LLAANLGVLLAKAGQKVILADLDFGGSNLHLILGIRGVQTGIGAFLTRPGISFDDIVLQTDQENLAFIPGDGEIPGIANMTAGQKRKLIGRLHKLDADYLILDLGAGTSYNVMDFFLMTSQGIVITTPTPTALVNAYLCLKNALYRLLTSTLKRGSPGAEYLKEIARSSDQLQRLYLPDLVKKLRKVDPESIKKYKEAAAKFRPRIVLNMLEDPKDAERITRLRNSCSEYLGLEVEHLGVIYRDDLQDIALSARLPIVKYKPGSVLAQAIGRIADKVVRLAEGDEELLSWSDADESFAEGSMEAEIDFDSKMEYISELLHSGALTEGDLAETVKSQQIEIGILRKENNLLRSKLLHAASQGFDVS